MPAFALVASAIMALAIVIRLVVAIVIAAFRADMRCRGCRLRAVAAADDRPGGSADCRPDNRAVAAIHVMADRCPGRGTDRTAYDSAAVHRPGWQAESQQQEQAASTDK